MKQTYQHLMLVPTEPSGLVESQIEEIMNADWFEPIEKRGWILVDANTLPENTRDLLLENELLEDPADYGISAPDINTYIGRALKRWNAEDGFYHA